MFPMQFHRCTLEIHADHADHIAHLLHASPVLYPALKPASDLACLVLSHPLEAVDRVQ